MQYCSFQHWLFFSFTTRHFLSNWALFHSFVCLHSFWSCFSALSAAYLTPTNLGGTMFQCHIFLSFSLFWGSQGKNAEKWFARVFQNPSPRPISLGWPCKTWLIVSCHDLRQGCGPCEQLGYFSMIMVFILPFMIEISTKSVLSLDKIAFCFFSQIFENFLF